MLWVCLALVGCRNKGVTPAGVEALLPREVASRVQPELAALVQVLPEGVEAFGYLDVRDLLQAPPKGDPLAGLFDDLVQMAERRWGVSPQALQGLGVVVLEQQVVLVGNKQAIATKPPTSELATLDLGKLSAVGSPTAIGALSAALRQKPRLSSTNAGWLQDALRHSLGQKVMFSALAEPFRAMIADEFGPVSENLVSATFVAGAEGAQLQMRSKPGKGGAVIGLVGVAIAAAKKDLAEEVAELAASADSSDSLGSAVLRHYGGAFFSSLQVQQQGDLIDLRLGWHAPKLLAVAPMDGLSERAIAPGEWNVLQVDLGVGALEYAIAASDVLSAPLDRAALHREVLAALAALLDLEPMDPRRFVMSTGSQVAVSIAGAGNQKEQAARPFAGSPMMLAPMRWGVALWLLDPAQLSAGVLPKPGAPLGLLTTSAAAKGPAFLRWIVDVSKAPATSSFRSMPLRSIELAVRGSTLEATAVAPAGQGAMLQAMLGEFGNSMVAQTETDYQQRAQSTVDGEFVAISQRHLAAFLAKLATPSSVQGDTLVFSQRLPEPSTLMLTIGGARILAAIAVPAFKDYTQKSKTSEAELQLAKLKHNVKSLYALDGAFPTVSAPLTPSTSCCTHGKKLCPVLAADWATVPWQSLDFQLDEPHLFRYELQSTPTRFVARAVGDLDCDGVEITYTLTGTVTNGEPTFTLTEPAPNAD